jgi:hypothetical protein
MPPEMLVRHLTEAETHVCQATRIVANQRRLIAKLKVDDRNTRNPDIVGRAETLLTLFEQQRNSHFSRLRRLADRLQSQSTPMLQK